MRDSALRAAVANPGQTAAAFAARAGTLGPSTQATLTLELSDGAIVLPSATAFDPPGSVDLVTESDSRAAGRQKSASA